MSAVFLPRRCTLPNLSALTLAIACLSAHASTNGVVISQVYGGGGNTGATYKNDFIELFNAGASSVNLNGWSVQYASASGASWASTAIGNVTLQPGQYLLIQEAPGANGTTALPTADATGTLPMSATAGKVALVNSTTALSGTAPSSTSIIDLVGFGSTATSYEGSAAATAPSNTTAIVRANAGCTDTDSNSSDFTAAAPAPRNTSSALNVCGGSTGGTGTSGGGTGTGTGTGTVTLTPIYAIQGTGSTSTLVGQSIVTQGVVTKVTNNSFYMQDPSGDGNPLTSDGVLVYVGSTPSVQTGQLVQVSAKVAEYNTGSVSNTVTANHTVTELTSPAITLVSSNQSVAPTPLHLPVASLNELERLEGMLVTITSPMVVSQNYFLGRFGQLTLSADARMETPTNRHRPGADADALNVNNTLSTILLDDGSSLQNINPTPYLAADNTVRAGDRIDTLTGVLDYGLLTADNTGGAAYKLQPTGAVSITRVNERSTAPESVGGNVKVASANVLNYFTTFTDGNTAAGLTGQGCTLGSSTAASNCRGANSLSEFTRQRAKIVASLSAIDADVVGLMEMQNNVPTGTGSKTNPDTAVQNLVDALNAKLGAGTYAVVPAPSAGTGTDAIRVAMIYKPAKLTLNGSALSDTDSVNNRPPMAQSFAAPNGEKFTVVVNHLKSKGSCPSDSSDENADKGDLQGCWNALRVQQAQRLSTFIGNVQASTGTNDVVMIGDFNAYAKEDPIDTLTSAGFIDEIDRFNSFGYSYVFDGAAGRLDHALTTASLSSKVTKAIEWHVNADEPAIIDYNLEYKQPACSTCGPDYYSATAYRSSDHDPVVIGLNLTKTINGTSGRDTIVGTAGDDVITGGVGADTLTGGTGKDVFVYTSVQDGTDTITDFTPGTDRIDLSTLLNSIGSTTPLASGVVRVISSTAGAAIQIDADGSTGPGGFRSLVTLRGVTASQINLARDLGLSQ